MKYTYRVRGSQNGQLSGAIIKETDDLIEANKFLVAAQQLGDANLEIYIKEIEPKNNPHE